MKLDRVQGTRGYERVNYDWGPHIFYSNIKCVWRIPKQYLDGDMERNVISVIGYNKFNSCDIIIFIYGPKFLDTSWFLLEALLTRISCG